MSCHVIKFIGKMLVNISRQLVHLKLGLNLERQGSGRSPSFLGLITNKLFTSICTLGFEMGFEGFNISCSCLLRCDFLIPERWDFVKECVQSVLKSRFWLLQLMIISHVYHMSLRLTVKWTFMPLSKNNIKRTSVLTHVRSTCWVHVIIMSPAKMR